MLAVRAEGKGTQSQMGKKHTEGTIKRSKKDRVHLNSSGESSKKTREGKKQDKLELSRENGLDGWGELKGNKDQSHFGLRRGETEQRLKGKRNREKRKREN